MNKAPLAIIGMGLRLPGNIYHPDGLWSALKEGRNCITDIPADRWSIEKYYDPDPNKAEKIKSKKGGFIDKMKEFDAEFFDIYPKVAQNIDPRQKHLLEVVFEAIEDAGLTLKQLNGSLTSVIMGVFLGDEAKKNAGSDLSGISPHTAMGSADTTVSARISYQFNLNGPSLSVDTACSSSLVATHLACNSIWSGDAQMAIVGGVNIMSSHEYSMALSKGGFLSSEGHCKSFDASGDGYVRGEGAAVVIIKSLKKAEEDGDNIYAVIRNTVVNSDGYTADGITVPNEFAQIDMLKKAYNEALIDPATVDFIEAHGTGTVVGDPKECFAFGNVFAEGRDKDKPLIIGSIKSNIGHTEAVAGIAGLAKLALCLKNKQIPKNLHFKNPNPKINFDEWKLKVPTELMDWPVVPGKKAVGGVNSFGAGGTNAHAVIEEYVAVADRKSTDNSTAKQFDFPHLFSISAKSENALKDLAKKYLEFIQASAHSLSDICYSTLKKRTSLSERLTIIAPSKDALLSSLTSFVAEQKSEGLTSGRVADKKPKIAFICSGQGPQWYAMGRQLLASSKIYFNSVKEIDAIFQKLSGYSLLDEMNKSAQDSRIAQTRIAQPAIMALQIGLIHMYESLGIKPDGIVGHSVGEVAAAYCAGALTLEQAVEVIYHRSREQDKASNSGKMLATDLTYHEAVNRIEGLGNKVSVAAINGPKMTVLSGDSGPLEVISKALEQEERFGKFLQVNIPFHSYHLDQIEEGMMSSLKNLNPSKAQIPLYSTVTGKQEDGLHLNNRYWFKNARDTVHFFHAIEKMIADGFDTFLEIAPHPVLGAGTEDAMLASGKTGAVISSLSRKVKEFEANIKYEDKDFLTSVAKLYTRGIALDFDALFAGENAKFVKLPHYAWQHQEYWAESKEHANARLKKPIHPFVKSITRELSNKNNIICELNLDPRRELYLKDHQIGGAIVFPGTAQFETAIAVGKEIYGSKFSHLENVHFHRALFLAEDSKTEARLEITSTKGDYKIWSRKDENEEWKHNGSGRMATSSESNAIPASLDALKQRITEEVSIDKFYTNLREGGLHYGPHFKLITQMWKNNQGEILAKVELPEDDAYILNQYNAIPNLSDACLHVILSRPDDGVFLPTSCKQYTVLNKLTKTAWSYVKVANYENDNLVGDIVSYSEAGQPILQASQIELKYLKNSRKASDDPYDGVYEYEWIKSELEPGSLASSLEQNECALIIADNFGDNSFAKLVAEKFSKDQLITVCLNSANDSMSGSQHYLSPSSKTDFENLFKTIAAQSKTLRKIINLWPQKFTVSESDNDKTLTKASQELIEPSLYLFQEIAKLDHQLDIYQVTSSADKVSDQDEKINFLQGLLYGMGRVFINEYPHFALRMIDLGCGAIEDNLSKLYQEITKEEKEPFETEVAIRDYGRFTRKLTSVTKEESQKIQRTDASSQTFAASYQVRSDNNQIVFTQTLPAPIGEHDVEIEVKFAGADLNKTDTSNLGFEASGIITKTGSQVTDFKSGDEVIAITSAAMSGKIIVAAHQVVKKPANLSFAQSATILVPYVTAFYALHKLANITEEDVVLIKDPTTAIGIAAIKLAKLAKAKVVTFASKDQNFLKELGVDQVLAPSSLRNPQSGSWQFSIVIDESENFTDSFDLLTPFSSLIRISNSDTAVEQTNAADLAKNISLHYLNPSDLFLKQKPKLIASLLQSVAKLFEQGGLKPDPLSQLKISDLAQAFKTGNKLDANTAVEISGEIPLQLNQEISFDSNCTYLITGGASGLGLALAKWLWQKGARSFALVSRSGPKYDSDKKIIQDLIDSGAKVVWKEVVGDVASERDMKRVVSYIKANMPPLKGVIHSAGILRDATYPNMSIDRFMEVYSPKAIGAWNLHRATLGYDLDLFLMISSVSSILGIAGQNNYSAANSFMNHLMIYRKAQGLAGKAACFGALSGEFAGMSKEGPEIVEMAYRIIGLRPMNFNKLTNSLENFIASRPTIRMISDTNWNNFGKSFSHQRKNKCFSSILELTSNSKNLMSKSLVDQLLLEPQESKEFKIITLLKSSLSNILGVKDSTIEENKPITNIGLDSLMLNQFRNWIQSSLGVNLSLMQIAKGPTIKELSKIVGGSIMHNNKPQPMQELSGLGQDKDLELLSNKWIIKIKNRDEDLRIFCLHPVGAGASIFSYFMFNPPKGTEVFALQMPGRENRSGEAHDVDMHKLVQDLANVIEPFLNKKTIFWGHSWGGVTLYEIIKYLKARNSNNYHNIIHFIVTGSIAPQLTLRWKEKGPIRETAKKENTFKKVLSTISYVENEEFLRRIFPTMQNDMDLIMSYKYQAGEKLDLPILAFGAEQDDVVALAELEQWREQTNGDFTMYSVHGDHWFLSRNKEFIKGKIEESISKLDKVLTVRTRLLTEDDERFRKYRVS